MIRCRDCGRECAPDQMCTLRDAVPWRGVARKIRQPCLDCFRRRQREVRGVAREARLDARAVVMSALPLD